MGPVQCPRRAVQRGWWRGCGWGSLCPSTQMAGQTKQLATNEDRLAGWHSRALLPRSASITGYNYLPRCCGVFACTCHAMFRGCFLVFGAYFWEKPTSEVNISFRTLIPVHSQEMPRFDPNLHRSWGVGVKVPISPQMHGASVLPKSPPGCSIKNAKALPRDLFSLGRRDMTSFLS